MILKYVSAPDEKRSHGGQTPKLEIGCSFSFLPFLFEINEVSLLYESCVLPYYILLE